MFAKKRHTRQRTTSGSTEVNVNVNVNANANANATPQRERPRTNAVLEPPLVSPLQMTFDFELSPPPPSSTADDYPRLSPFSPILESTSSAPAPPPPAPPPPPRPQTSTGLGSLRNEDQHHDKPNGLGAAGRHSQSAPTLPPIPRVASQANGYMSSHLNENVKPARHSASNTRHVSEDSFNIVSDSALNPRLSFEHPMDMLPSLSRDPSPASTPQTAGGTSNNSTPKMESSLFPAKPSASLLPSTSSKQERPLSSVSPNVPLMNRQFIDSRDKPYSQPPPRPIMTQHNHSTPHLYRPQSPAIARGPSPMYSSTKSFISPRPSLQNLSQRTNLSGSNARPSTRTSTQTAQPSPSVTTIGTPYGATADSFPLPQHVMTRPKTPGAAARIGGVSVPTHHTSSSRTANGARPVETKEPKKKRRLTFNPMALLQRRQTSQLPEELLKQRQEQERALQRQRDLLVSGVNKPPPDFDPRIKGRVVHDFSAPRGKRNTFDEVDMVSIMSPPLAQSTQSSPVVPTLSSQPPLDTSLTYRGSDGEQTERRSVHTPAFKEHLDEAPESSRRISSIQAESLENKDFLHRASKHNSALTNLSQESATLPPFARRSQILDPGQAAFYNDESSKASTSSDRERGSSLGSNNEVSPVTARSSQLVQQTQQADVRQSQSPVSPASLERPGDYFRPVSSISPTPLSSVGVQSASQLSTPKAWNNEDVSTNEMTSRPYSVVMAPPAIYTVSEGSNESSPVQGPSRDYSEQQPQVVLRGVSIRHSKSSGGLSISSLPPPPMPGSHSGSTSPGANPSRESPTNIPTPEKTPELEAMDSVQFKPNNAQPKLVEKRPSAVGHSRKSSNVPRHASTASRFSFQFGGNESAAQEQALEEKHRKMRNGQIAQSIPRGRSPDEDDEDEFDEDAMYDMDEMEMENIHDEPAVEAPPIAAQSANYLQQARQVLQQQDSNDESHYGDEVPDVLGEGDLPYPDHPAFRTYSAVFNNYSRPDSYVSQGGRGGYWRDSTIDHYMLDEADQPRTSNQGFEFGLQSTIPEQDTATAERSQTGLSPILSELSKRPRLPARDSGHSERNRAASGISFGQASTTGSRTERNASAGASTAPIDRENIVSGASYSSVSESVKSPMQSTFYKQAESAKSSPYLASGSFSPPFPDEHDSWLDDGTCITSGTLASPLQSPQREAALVSLEANSRMRASSSESDSSDRDTELDGAHSADNPILPTTDNNADAGGLAKNAVSSTHSKSETPRRSPYSDGRRNGSIGALSFSFSESPDKRSLAHNSSGSGMSFEEFARGGFSQTTSPVLPSNELGYAHRSPLSQGASPIAAQSDGGRRPRSPPIKSNGSPTVPAGLGLNVFSGFDFNHQHSVTETPGPSDSQKGTASSSITSPQAGLTATSAKPKKQSPAAPRADWSELSNHTSPSLGSATSAMPTIVAADTMAVTGKVNTKDGNVIHNGSHESTNQNMPYRVSPPERIRSGTEINADDMYFDDGNFGQDINGVNGNSIDEDAFDDDRFLSRPGFMNRYMHSRDHSGLSALSTGSDGPYPAFAIPNAHRTSQRYSSLMLEDLPLQAPVDPRYVPQRNPSEDAKRLGLGSSVPPAPVLQNDREALDRMQKSLQRYHSALADAANRAAMEGRFVRAPSISTTHSADNTLSLQINDAPMGDDGSIYAASIGDDRSVYSNGEDGGELHMPYLNTGKGPYRNGSASSRLTHLTSYSPTKFSFDFGFEQDPITDDINDGAFDDDMFGNDDDLVAAANAEVLASDDGGFYGQEFGFYGRPRSNSDQMRAINGGYFGEDGDDGLTRNKSLKEPDLTPITERSEFSTRNSFVGLGGPFGPASANPFGSMSPALARFPVDGHAPASFDELRKLRGQAFGGGGGARSSNSNSSARSNSNRSSSHSLQALSPSVELKPGLHGSGYFGGAFPTHYGHATDSNNGSRNSSIPNSAHPASGLGLQVGDRPQSAASSNSMPFGVDLDATPRKNIVPMVEPTTAKKVANNGQSHSSSGSGADSVTYVREPDPEHNGKQRWVLEKRRTSEQGQLELIGRELVQGGWI